MCGKIFDHKNYQIEYLFTNLSLKVKYFGLNEILYQLLIKYNVRANVYKKNFFCYVRASTKIYYNSPDKLVTRAKFVKIGQIAPFSPTKYWSRAVLVGITARGYYFSGANHIHNTLRINYYRPLAAINFFYKQTVRSRQIQTIFNEI